MNAIPIRRLVFGREWPVSLPWGGGHAVFELVSEGPVVLSLLPELAAVHLMGPGGFSRCYPLDHVKEFELELAQESNAPSTGAVPSGASSGDSSRDTPTGGRSRR